MSRRPIGDEREELPEGVENLWLKIMKNTQTEISNGDTSAKANLASVTSTFSILFLVY